MVKDRGVSVLVLGVRDGSIVFCGGNYAGGGRGGDGGGRVGGGVLFVFMFVGMVGVGVGVGMLIVPCCCGVSGCCHVCYCFVCCSRSISSKARRFRERDRNGDDE